ncbi:MAG: hypothetical protein P0Y65_14625 [Candidatus Devosia phytovorans]|uniref:DUF1176 domain-containing protein n=1 Tax=Candidatus Devosia phytovorans TaxID=3121372 RepID=A0AAJ5VTP5_9HYPH|nr:DUF1176 domain-containing protein [Devosia sp.]WEK03422.1 MAG: hypothetical protein P0Y65_14625 [Devosia sp.]
MRNSLILAASAALLTLPSAAQEGYWQADAVAKALDHHMANRPELCMELDPSQTEPASFELQVGEETAARQALIVEFPCQIGAYSVTSVYLLSDQHGTVSEIVFPSPKFDVAYDGEGEDQTVRDIVIYETPYLREVVNPSYDSSSRTMSERNKWRGLGDAYTETRWGFKQGKFEITYFAVDATFNGEADPIVLIDRDIW